MITINYPVTDKQDKKVIQFIMNWLFLGYDLIGNEDELAGDSLVDLICESGMIALGNGLNKEFDEDVYLPKDLKFIKL